MVDLSKKITQEEFGKLVGIARQSVGSYISRGILRADATGGEWLLAYCDNLREVAAGRYADGELDLPTERARLARAQTERLEMQNAVTRKELVPVGVVEEILSKAGSRAVRIIEAVPARLKRSCEGVTAQMVVVVRDELARACNAVACMSLATLNDDQDNDTDG